MVLVVVRGGSVLGRMLIINFVTWKVKEKKVCDLESEGEKGL